MAKRIKVNDGVKVTELLPRVLDQDERLEVMKSACALSEEIASDKEAFIQRNKEAKTDIGRKQADFDGLMKIAKNGIVLEPREAIRKVSGRTVHYFDDEGVEIHSRAASDTDLQIQLFEQDITPEMAGA